MIILCFHFIKLTFFVYGIKLMTKVKLSVDNITMSYFGRGLVGGSF